MSRLRGIACLALFALAVSLSGSCRTRPGRASDADRPAPILVLVSFDGWRFDYIDRFATPHLRALAARGARARALIPSFPVLTFPNHYTIVTGLYPAHHGIVANTMQDPAMPARFSMSADTAKDAAWWGGEPLWATAIRQGRRAATMFWPGTEAAIGGVRPDAWRPYDKAFATPRRVEQVVEWLAQPEGARPDFVSVYFDEVDTAGHDQGVDSPELAAAVSHLDDALGQIVAAIARLRLDDRTTIVVVSDHGMAPLSPSRVVYLDDYVDPERVDILESTGMLAAAPKDGDVAGLYRSLHGRHPALAVYTRDTLPARLHYGGSPRIAPVIGIPEQGWAVTTRARLAARPLQAATHGFEPRDPLMGAVFVAAGPRIRRGLVVAEFENVEIYEFLCDVLGLQPAKNDGRRGFVSGQLTR